MCKWPTFFKLGTSEMVCFSCQVNECTSIVGTFLFFMFSIAKRTSAMPWGKDGGSAGSSRSGRLRTSSKCCTHLAACFLSVVITFCCFSFTGMLWLVLLPQSCLVILNLFQNLSFSLLCEKLYCTTENGLVLCCLSQAF